MIHRCYSSKAKKEILKQAKFTWPKVKKKQKNLNGQQKEGKVEGLKQTKGKKPRERLINF